MRNPMCFTIISELINTLFQYFELKVILAVFTN